MQFRVATDREADGAVFGRGLGGGREREQRAAAHLRGVEDVRFLEGYRDGWLVPEFELVRRIVEVIRDVRPQRVLSTSTLFMMASYSG